MTQTTTAPAEGPRNTFRTDVYLAEDGLLHCKSCGTPVQCRVTFAGAEQTVFCMCRCRKERRERALQQAKERERMLDIRRLKALGIQERHLLRWRFDTARDTSDLRMAKRRTHGDAQGYDSRPEGMLCKTTNLIVKYQTNWNNYRLNKRLSIYNCENYRLIERQKWDIV